MRLRGRREGDGVPHRHRRPAAHQSLAPGGLRHGPPGVDARGGVAARRSGREGRDRVRRGRPVSDDPYNAFVTRVEPGPAGEGPLAGRTLAVKDLIDTAGVRTTYGSGLYGEHVPERTATVVQRLLDAGAVLVGKTHLPEFAWSVLGKNEFYGTCHNPTHPGKTTGGSSTGNAAALAAGLCELALGTDTGCSIRLPSACCEVVGLKSQWGLIPMDGVFPLVPTARHRRADGAHRRATSRSCGRCSTGRPVPEPRLAGLTVGLLRQPPGSATGARRSAPTPPRRGSPDLERLGARVVEATRARADREHLAAVPARGAAVSRGDVPSRADEYGDIVRTKLELAQRVIRRRGRGGVPRARRVAPLRARGRPLRVARATRLELPAGGRRTSSTCASRSPRSCAGSNLTRLGRPRDREHAAGRARGTRSCSPPGSPGSAASYRRGTRACASRRTPRRPRGSRPSSGAGRRRGPRARARRGAARRRRG